MEKEGKFNLKFIFAIGFLLILMSFFSFGVVVTLNAPTDGSINTSVTRNINFTFTPTWNATGEVIGNCTLYTNFSGTWQSAIEFNGSSLTQENNGSSNITNGSLSWVNYTFTRDLSNFVWNIGCYNGTGTALVLNFSTNRTLAIDVVAPAVVQTADIFSLFNTSSATPTITVNITDGGNGTGVDLTNGANEVLNITLFDVNTGADSQLVKYNTSNSSFTCTPTGNGAQIFQCTLNIANSPLTNGTKNLTVNVKDKANLTNQSSFLFTVDNIAPVLHYLNITNASTFNAQGSDVTTNNSIGFNKVGGHSLDQGVRIFAVANWTDNLTRPFHAALQFFNSTSGSWQTINTTKNVDNAVNISPSVTNVNGWGNLSFFIPTGHNEFEGRNISFRIVVNDTLGNIDVADSVRNITIQINDTTVASVTIPNGTIQVNGTNTTDTTPTVSWRITEHSALTLINVSVDKNTHGGTGVDSNCGLSAIYTTVAGPNNVERNRNGTFTVVSDSTCSLTNGTHIVNITVTDVWSNTVNFHHVFTVQTGVDPVISFNGADNGEIVNDSTVTSLTGLNFSATVGNNVNLRNITFTSSCNSTGGSFTQNTTIKPFQGSCTGTTGNKTITVTATDTADVSTTNIFQFLLDDTPPRLSVNAPTNSLSSANNVTINVSAKDDVSNISMFGYYLDDNPFVTLNSSAFIGDRGVNITGVFSQNFTPGTHTIKFTASDGIGTVTNNTVNSSAITITVTGPVNFINLVGNLNNATHTAYGTNLTNVTLRIKSAGAYILTDINDTANTFEIGILVNNTINVTLTDLNGSAANWNKANFTPIINDTRIESGIANNWTITVLRAVVFNNSLEDFISNNNSYFGTVTVPFNISSYNDSGAGFSLAQEFWWIPNENDLTTRTNITSQCGGTTFTASTLAPCWNYTSGGRTLIFVPHFSVVVVVNDSTAPSTTINTPSTARGNQSIGVFEFNISVSQDTVNCRYSINATAGTANVTMTKTGTTCMGQTEFFKNNDGKYNITFYATDASNNIGTTVFHLNVSDTGAPITSGDITSSPSTTTASVSVSANETVNVTVNFGTSNATLGTKAHETDFNLSQSVSLASLTASTTYFYNVTICDFNGNCLTNGSFTFTTSAAAAAAAAASTSSGSSGGGGGAAAPSNVAAETSKKWDALAGGSSATLTINNANIAVTGVVIDVKSAVTNAEIKVASLVASPFTAAAETKIYQYLQLTKSNIADTDASKITINFKVPKSWLSTNAVAEGDIVLYRYSDSKWNALETAMTGSDTDNILYSSVTPGFSTFAIGSKEAAPAAPAAETPAEVPAAPAEEAAPAAPAAETPAEEAMEKKGLSSTAIAWIVVAVIVVVAAVGYTMMKRKE